MIITLTPNPAIDHTLWVSGLRLIALNRYRASELDPAGKGINVSRMAHRLGWPTVAFGFLAGETGHMVRKALDDEGVQHHFVPVPGQTRINVVVLDEVNCDETGFYGPGPAVGREAQAELEAMLRSWLHPGRVLVLAGTLPPGVPQDAYAGYIERARQRGVRTILNAGGQPLRLGLRARPDLVKVNTAEAEALVGRSLPDVQAAVAAARELVGRGVGAAVITMGARGAVGVRDERVWWASAPPAMQRTKVGAGDSLVAGLAVAMARGDGFVAGLRLGTAAAAAAVTAPATALGTAERVAELLPQVRVEEVTEVALQALRAAEAAPPPAPQARRPAPPPRLLDGGIMQRLTRFVGRYWATRALEPPKRPVGPRERLRYAMDIDGTITQAPRHFKRLVDALLAAGDQVVMLTARFESTRQETELLLSSLGIQYDELLMRPDDWRHSIADFKVERVRGREIHMLLDDDPRNCWAVIQRTEALAGHVLPIPETPEAAQEPLPRAQPAAAQLAPALPPER